LAIQEELKVTLIDSSKTLEKTIATAYKTCYSPLKAEEIYDEITKEEGGKFINKILNQTNNKHVSPLEHSYFTFAIDGISRITAQQLTRHRIASFSMQSQRYVDMGDFKYKIPKEIENIGYLKQHYIKDMDKINKMYSLYSKELLLNYVHEYGFVKIKSEEYDNIYATIKKIILFLADEKKELNENEINKIINESDNNEKDKKDFRKYIASMHKKAIENARYILPGAASSSLVYSTNAASLLHFLALRDCKRAQDEIREIAKQIIEILKTESPLIYNRAGAGCKFGACPEGKFTCGVPYNKKELVEL